MAKTELIVALDMGSTSKALDMARSLHPEVSFFKVGSELFVACGPEIIDSLKEIGCRVFLDLKFHDIPNQVAGAVKAAAKAGADIITIHTLGGTEMMRAASEAGREVNPGMKIVGVTILTSMDQETLAHLGIAKTTDKAVLDQAGLALSAGLDGVVASGVEISELRKSYGGGFLIVTPGIRSDRNGIGDQKRTVTPGRAIAAGATHLVVGRPIIRADDPKEAALSIIALIERAEMGAPR